MDTQTTYKAPWYTQIEGTQLAAQFHLNGRTIHKLRFCSGNERVERQKQQKQTNN